MALFRQQRVITLAGWAFVFGILPAWVLLSSPDSADGAGCSFEPAPADPQAPLTRHLPKSCTQQERDRLAVSAGELLSALVEGRGIDLSRVVVTGDLRLDELPPRPAAAADFPSARLKEAAQSQRVTEIRVLGGPLSIRDSIMRGEITTNLRDGFLVVQGPVTTTGTTFERKVDFSHTVFSRPADFTDSILLEQGFFIQAFFTGPARFERTAFGVHSRFHRAVFADSVTFLRSGFNGLSEFLEVSFEKDVSFSRTYFKQGAGFSGSRFLAGLDFTEATFEREAFFVFTLFEGDAYFRRATFRAGADFSDAEFKGLADFSKVFFEVPPKFAGTKVNPNRRSLGGLQDPKVLYAIVSAVLVFTLVFILLARKM